MESTHKKRILTAIIVLPILIWVVFFSPVFLFDIFILLISCIASLEQVRLWQPNNKFFIFFSIFISLIMLFCFMLSSPLLGIMVAFFLASIYFIWVYGCSSHFFHLLPLSVFSLIYPNFLLGHAFFFLNLTQGRKLLLWTLFIVFSSDTGAFYIGRKFGKHKIYPAVSPKKSWEGLIGGVSSALLMAFFTFSFLPLSLLKTLFLSFVIALIEQTGDFFESALKRQAGLKDSGRLLPGHGGILDRIDGILFALPVSYYLLVWWLK